MPRPSTTSAPAARAAASSGVSSGWYTRSATTRPGRSAAGAIGVCASPMPNGPIPIGVALTTMSASATAASRSAHGTVGAPASAAADAAASARRAVTVTWPPARGERERHRPRRAARAEDEHARAGGFALGFAQRAHESFAVGGVAVDPAVREAGSPCSRS